MLEQAKTLWVQKDGALAMRMLHALLSEAEQRCPGTDLHAIATMHMGQWLAESYAQATHIIVSDYLEKSVSMLEALVSLFRSGRRLTEVECN